MPEVVMSYQGRTAGDERDLALAAAGVPACGAFSAVIAQPLIFRTALLALGGVIKANYEVLDMEEWLARVLDPIVGIHPDGVSFEAFSQDCSTLGWVHFGNTVFARPAVQRGGCTNIDYTEALEAYLRSMTPVSQVRLSIGNAEGVALAGTGGTHHEKKD